MQRVTNQMMNNTMTYNLRRQSVDMDRIQNSLATGKKIQAPRDNPIGTANQMLYQSRLTEMDQYGKNISEGKSRLNEIDSSLQAVNSIFQRLRVLSVEGANGIYTSFERKEAAATEINQLLEELVAIGNTKGANGRSIFGGYDSGTEENPDPFVPIYQTLTAGNQGNAMIGVEYRGDIGKLQREVAKGEFVDVNVPGNQAFWASNQVLTSNTDASTYVSDSHQVIRIDGKEVGISAGDNIDIIIDKINHAGLSVKATKGGRNNLVLESDTPHQIWLEDAGSGRVLKDLGMINPNIAQPPNNLHPTVIVDGQSIFEMAIRLRDDMVRGDVELVGGRDLGMLDIAMDNVLRNLAAVGAKSNRIDELAKRNEYDKTNVMDLLAQTEGIDYAEEIMNFKWLEQVHQYALAVGAKTIKPTLMDFLR